MTRRSWLFAYGTLREPKVQRSVFGRTLAEGADALEGFELGLVRLGGRAYPILRRARGPAPPVAGAVLAVTAQDLARADAYEGAAYRRDEVTLASGRRACVYVDAQSPPMSSRPLRLAKRQRPSSRTSSST